MLKKWIALILCLGTMLSMLPFAVTAEETQPQTAVTELEQTAQPEQSESEKTEQEETLPEVKEKTESEEEVKPKLEQLSPAQAAIPTNKLPTKAARIQRLRYYIQWDYQNALEQEERESLYSFCGLLASYQLYYRGINTWRRCYDGKDYYDAYAEIPMTDGGYTIRAYNALKEPQPETTEPPVTLPEETPATTEETTAPVQTPAAETPAEPEAEITAEPEVPTEPEKYTIAELLNQITNYGSKEVYNLLVCFDKTDTARGTIYGHVVFVYGIIDGIVYFTEGGDMFGVKAGEPMECSISQFSASYASWTDFEGLIVFGNKDFKDNCLVYSSDLFICCTENLPLLPLPNPTDNSDVQRIAVKGERLQVTGLYQNRDGEYYYEIYDGGVVCYTPAQYTKAIWFNHAAMTLEDPKLPEKLKVGSDYRLDGTVESAGYIRQVMITVLDAQGVVVQEVAAEVNESSFDLYNWKLNQALALDKLEEGVYTLRVEAEDCNWFIYMGHFAARCDRQTVAEQIFTVGDVEVPPVEAEAEPEPPVKDGWIYENNTWYCYREGTPLTGWQYADGVWYYLREDGSVSTDWNVVDRKMRLFTATGAMRTGWVKTEMGRQYLLADGTIAHGWLQLDGEYYYFDDFGVWQEDYMRLTINQMSQLDLPLSAALPQEE